MYDNVREKVISKYGSINKLAKDIDVSAQDLYCAFNGKKPFFPKWRMLVADAIGEDENVIFTEEK